MKLNSLTVDARRENEGAWVVWPQHPTVSARVRSIHNPDYKRESGAKFRSLRTLYNGEVPTSVSEKANAELIRDYVLLDLKGLEDDDGSPIPYTPEFGYRLLTEQQFRPISDFVVWAAVNVGKRELAQSEADVGNSPAGSSGTSPKAGTSKP